ncbi:hypothetical protein CDL15_Pgr020114 [Punica granatum]|uniref:DYW domain-containing protein n=1 Tax=Punica granatum TaxID=22663 RepID=A0A218VRV1_PUNGR|nr:hypothetical protein CDL15_Pgr020114 [Punica granatum]
MFRRFPTSTPTRTTLRRRPDPSLTTCASLSPSPVSSPKGSPFIFNSQNPTEELLNPSRPLSIPLKRLVDDCRTPQTHVGSAPISWPGSSTFNSQVHDHLVAKYQGSSCSKDAKELHLQMFKTGFNGNLFLGNTLINIYVKSGDLGSALKVFDEMPNRNSVTWACLVSGSVQNRSPYKACTLFKDMIFEGFSPNHYVFGSVLRACQEFGSDGLKFGMQVHGRISKSCYAGDVVVSNVLISMYGGCSGSTDDALSAFYEIKLRNSISWNSMISIFSQRGDVETAFELFSCMQRDCGCGYGLKPSEYTFGTLITATYSSGRSGLHLLEQILGRVEKSGFLSDLYVGSALVSGLARFGLTDYAKDLFQQMSMRNAITMNGLMVGLTRQKRGEEATEVFMETRDSVDMNIESFVVLLSACAEFSAPDEGKKKGREVHAYFIRAGLIDAKVALGNGLINMYAKCGSIDEARSVFTLMINKDLVSWNSLISGFDQNECFESSGMSYHEMRRTGLFPGNFTLISTLSSCASLGWIRLGQQIQAEGLKLGLDLDVSVSNALLALYAETGHIAECQRLFTLMAEHDQVSWNSMIGALADSELEVSKAVEYFSNMMQAGWNPNRITFMNILSAISSLSFRELGHQIHALVLKHDIGKDTAIENALLACYGKCGELDPCEKIFSRMHERRDDVSWNSMVSGYIHNEFLTKAMDLVWFMLQRGQRLDSFTFATVLSACASVATLERGMEVHACGTRSCLESDVVVGSALVDMYAKCGRIDYASRFFELMPVRNVYSWNSMISGYARHGLGVKALELFMTMKLSGQAPDHVTFIGVLSACSHVGFVDEGFRHFKSMTEEFGLVPRMEHYSCMVDLLGRAGKLNKIEDFINSMPMKSNVLIWRTVLGAFGRANGRNHKSELGQRAAQMLLQLEPQNAVNYVLLSNMYASGEKWEDMARARKAMRQAQVKKEAGCSWVTMKDGVHVFVAGDKSHPERDVIYEKLKELNAKMRDMGYVPETRFALYDLDLENKEELLSYHSEKIAVAFVLTRKSEMPIRIMKNLRVCGDCHVAFKYISKIVRRKIVLRDLNRFHHFEDGECSCRDYW